MLGIARIVHLCTESLVLRLLERSEVCTCLATLLLQEEGKRFSTQPLVLTYALILARLLLQKV